MVNTCWYSYMIEAVGSLSYARMTRLPRSPYPVNDTLLFVFLHLRKESRRVNNRGANLRLKFVIYYIPESTIGCLTPRGLHPGCESLLGSSHYR